MLNRPAILASCCKLNYRACVLRCRILPTTVTSHVRSSPACHGINVKPSGRFSSDRHTATGSSHMPYRIARCYLPPDRGDIPAFTLAEAGIRLSDPGGMQGCVDLAGWLQTETVYPPEDGHPSRY